MIEVLLVPCIASAIVGAVIGYCMGWYDKKGGAR